MSTTVVPLHPSPFDPVATAELERVVMGLTADEWAEFRAQVRAAYEACPAHLRHLLVVVEERDDSHLVLPMEWTAEGTLVEVRRRRLRVEQLATVDDLPRPGA